MNTWAVVLAGGIGSRFWPLSTSARPKQFLPLITDQPLLRDTLSRIQPVATTNRTLVLTNATLAPAVAEVAAALPQGNVLAEPAPAGTAIALAWAASEIQRRGGERDAMVCVHADWAIGSDTAFSAALLDAARLATETGALVTVGVTPTRDDPGLGYVVPGEDHPQGGRRVRRFEEKPTRERATELRREGALWNSGIFAWRVDVFLRELRAHTPEVSRALDIADAGAFFAAVQPVSIDVGLLERTNNVIVLPGDFGWDDVGTWGALRRAGRADRNGNVTHGAVHALDARGNVVYSDGPAVVLYGVNDLVVVTAGGLTLVTTPDHSAELKTLLSALPPELRDRK